MGRPTIQRAGRSSCGRSSANGTNRRSRQARPPASAAPQLTRMSWRAFAVPPAFSHRRMNLPDGPDWR